MSSSDVRSRMHGGPLQRELDMLSIDYRDVLDFSVSTNPYGPAPQMREAVARAAIDRYPEPTAALARRAVAEWLDVNEQGVVIGNGAADLLWAIARAFVTPQDTVLVVEPTFSELSSACKALGARVLQWHAAEADNFAVDLTAVSNLARESGARLVYLCTPNTPTGTSISAHTLSRWAERHGDCVLVIDQSFLSLSEDFADREVSLPGNVVIVRSLTKDHALPGLRVGYLVTTPRRAALIEAQRPAWSASAMAQAAAIAATQLDAFVADSRVRLLDDRRALAKQLDGLGLVTAPSRASFLMTRVADSARIRTTLLVSDRILVRDCASFGLPGWLRIAARGEADRARLLQALGEALT